MNEQDIHEPVISSGLTEQPESEADKMESNLEPVAHPVTADTNSKSVTTLLNPEELEHFHTRWGEIQGKFVDEPREAVRQAETLITEMFEKFTQRISSEHDALKGQGDPTNSLSTEDLRKALLRYRTFFNRLTI